MNINMKTVKSKFLHRPLVLVNAYKCAKFQLPSSISYGDMEGSKKMGLLISCSHSEDIWWESTFVLRIARFQTTLIQI